MSLGSTELIIILVICGILASAFRLLRNARTQGDAQEDISALTVQKKSSRMPSSASTAAVI